MSREEPSGEVEVAEVGSKGKNEAGGLMFSLQIPGLESVGPNAATLE